MGYTNSQVYDFTKNGATDLPCSPLVPCPGFDKYTGWGRINMGQSMQLASRSSPGMAIVPDAGYAGVQWFNFQASGFERDAGVELCLIPPFGAEECVQIAEGADDYGVIGIGLQFHSQYWEVPQFGTWGAYMHQTDPPNPTGGTTPQRTFVVLDPSNP